jgi:ubiquinone/menaquinone biosynthesis C-methylase UbiE
MNVFYHKYLGINSIRENDSYIFNNKNYIIKNNILRQQLNLSNEQNQTEEAFGFKWSKRSTYESCHMQKKIKDWLVERYLDGNMENSECIFKKGFNVLDAGCGAGVSAIALMEEKINSINYLGVDISEAVDIAHKRFKERELKGEFIQANLLNLPFNKPIFDIIFSEGVLHHTDSTEKAIKYLSRFIVPGGIFMFYVYRKKAPIREFCDDYIREKLLSLNNEEAWNELIPLTKLGEILGDLKLEVEIPEDIKLLEIPKGKINIQRLFYWYIFKAYYDENFTIDEMNHINFDWYRPLNCHRQTLEEVNKWCEEAGMKIERKNVQEAGITIIARKVE